MFKVFIKCVLLLMITCVIVISQENDRCNDGVTFLQYDPMGEVLATVSGTHLCHWQSDGFLDVDFQIAALDWSSDGKLIVLAGHHGDIAIVDMNTMTMIQRFEFDSRYSTIQFNPESEIVVTGDHQSTIQLRETQTGELLSMIDVSEQASPLRDYDTRIEAVAWHPSEPRVVAVGQRGVVIVLNVEDRALFSYWNDDYSPYLNDLRDLPMFTVDWHPTDTNIILTGGGDINNEYDNTFYPFEGRLLLWELSEERVTQPLASLDGHADVVTVATFSIDGEWIASADGETLRIWNYETLDNVSTIELEGIIDIAWKPDGTQLAVASSTGIHLYEFYEGLLTELES